MKAAGDTRRRVRMWERRVWVETREEGGRAETTGWRGAGVLVLLLAQESLLWIFSVSGAVISISTPLSGDN